MSWKTPRSVRLLPVVGLTGLALLASACSSAEAVSKEDVVSSYAEGVFLTYEKSVKSAKLLDSAVDAFAAAPSEATMTIAKNTWLTARDDYGRTEAFRFYGGPIDDASTGPEGLINAWPLDEAYIDYVEGNATAGIVNNAAKYPTINAEVLTEVNEKEGETAISTGWHAIEFLLWGQDLSTTGPGARPATDYTTAANADRRKAYLTTASDLLVKHLTEVADAWAPSKANYRADFIKLDPNEALRRMVLGAGELSRGELAGERMSVAYENRSQEDEHSCFSDNTTADLVANAESIRMVLEADFGAPKKGKSFIDLVAKSDKTLADNLRSQLNASVADVRKIPAPFDKALAPGVSDSDPSRVAITTAMDAISKQADTMVQAAKAVGVTVNVA